METVVSPEGVLVQHLTPDEVERFASARVAPAPSGARSEHLSACAHCREEVALLRALFVRLSDLEPSTPSRDFADFVMRRVELPPSRLERELARLPRWSPAPGFATHVMARVRLPIPWHERLWRFARRRRIALAGVGAATVTVSGVSAAWLFGAQGMAPGQVVALVVSGARGLLIEAMMAAGQFGYRLGLIDAGGSIVDQISPTAALGSLGLVSTVGLLSLWIMMRLFQAPPQTVVLRKAA